MVSLAIHFRSRGHSVSFLTYYTDSFFLNKLKREGITAFCIDESRPMQRILKMRRLIRSGDHDIVLAFLETPAFICETGGLPWRGWKLVVSERSSNPAMLRSFKFRFYRYFHAFADVITANSELNKDMIFKINRRIGERIQVVYNMVDLQKYSPCGTGYIPRRNGRLRIVIAAGRRPVKNFTGLAKALSLLTSQERSCLEIHWYGDKHKFADRDEDDTFMIAQYSLESIVNMYPANMDIHKQMQDADAIGLFSLYEGLPNTICEGMACGKPIICSRVSDMGKLVAEGANGFLCDPTSPQSIAAALRKLLACTPEQLLKMGMESRARAEKLFSPEATADRYLLLMRQAVEKRVGRLL